MDTGQKLLEDALESEATGTTVTSRYRGVPVVFKLMNLKLGIEAIIAGKYCTCWTFFPQSMTPREHICQFVLRLKKAIDDDWRKELKDLGQI